jgi:hypothetical protein
MYRHSIVSRYWSGSYCSLFLIYLLNFTYFEVARKPGGPVHEMFMTFPEWIWVCSWGLI